MKPAASPDEWLMTQVARGNREALDVLVRRYASPLLTFVTRMVGDHHRGEELFQEVFLAVWINRKRFDPYRSFKPWLYRIAINTCRASFRRRTLPIVGSVYDNPGISTSDPSPHEMAVAIENGVQVSAAVTLLSDQQRTVLVLRTWLDLPYAEIAEIMGRSVATVRSHMHHALAALRAHLRPHVP